MPEIPPGLENCVFFAFAKSSAGKTKAVGTGFFICVRVDGEGSPPDLHTYAVTNQHVISDVHFIRFTLGDGSIGEIEIPHWEFIDGGPDIALADVTEDVDAFGPNLLGLARGTFVTPEFSDDAQLNIGEDGFMLGLFADEPGTKRNAPIGRFGNLAAMADKDHRIEQPNGYHNPTFLFDLRSRTGFSGSPVFIYRTGQFDMSRLLRNPDKPPKAKKLANAAFVKLLGVHCGQYPELVKYKVVDEKRAEAIEDDRAGEKIDWADGSKLVIPSSITMVVPAWEIERVLDLKNFKTMREDREKRIASGGNSGLY